MLLSNGWKSKEIAKYWKYRLSHIEPHIPSMRSEWKSVLLLPTKNGVCVQEFCKEKNIDSHRSRDRFYFLLHLSFDRHMLNNRFRRFASFSSTREIYLCFTSSIIWKAELAEAKIFHFKCKICGMKIILTVKINFFDGKSQSLSWKQFNAEKFWAKWNSFNEICLLFLLFFPS